MNKLNQILQHPLYISHKKAIDRHERHRSFCRHDTQHFLDVSRIGYIYILEAGYVVAKEVVYGFGFLHDIGRGVEAEEQQPHHQSSYEIAKEILKETDYSIKEQALILKAIISHRNKALAKSTTFEGYMYRADKASRACYECKAQLDCYWENNKKNLVVEV